MKKLKLNSFKGKSKKTRKISFITLHIFSNKSNNANFRKNTDWQDHYLGSREF